MNCNHINKINSLLLHQLMLLCFLWFSFRWFKAFDVFT